MQLSSRLVLFRQHEQEVAVTAPQHSDLNVCSVGKGVSLSNVSYSHYVPSVHLAAGAEEIASP